MKNAHAALALVLGTSAFVLYCQMQFAFDDPYITYRVSTMLATGHGPVFNPGETHLATSGPGWMLLLALVGQLSTTLIAPVGLYLSGALCVASALLVFQMFKCRDMLIAAVVSGVMLVSFRNCWESLGCEIWLQMALMLAGVYMLFFRPLPRTTRNEVLAAVAFGSAILTRPDGLIGVAVICSVYALTERRVPSWKATLVALAIAAPWYLFAWSFFGSPLPPTMEAKQAQVIGGVAQIVPFGNALAWDWTAQNFVGLWILVLVCGIAFVSSIVKRMYHILAIFLWAIAHALFYTHYAVSFYVWYTVPIYIAIAVAVGSVTQDLYDRASDSEQAHKLALLACRLALLGSALLLVKWMFEEIVEYFSAIAFLELDSWQVLAAVSGVLLLALLFRRTKIARIADKASAFYGRAHADFSKTAEVVSRVLGTKWFRYGLAPAALVLFCAYPLRVLWFQHLWYPGDRFMIYKEVGQWLNSQPPTEVGYLEIGVIGYGAPNAKIVDALGLASPGMLDNVRKGRPFDSYKSDPPELLLVHSSVTIGLLREEWFLRRYERTHSFENSTDHIDVYALKENELIGPVRWPEVVGGPRALR